MNKKIQENIDDALFNFYCEADKKSIDEQLNVDINNKVEYEKNKKKLIFLAKAHANKKRNDYLLSLVAKFQEGIQSNIEKPISMLKSLIQNNNSPALYSNLNKLSKDDIIELIKDKNLVDLLEQLDADDKKH
jgi:Mg/Co/Ni transporter MgtE